jgi:hypothetical protein
MERSQIQIGFKRPFCHAFFPPVPGSVSFSKIFAKNIDAVRLRFHPCYCDVQRTYFFIFQDSTRITFGTFFETVFSIKVFRLIHDGSLS